MHHVRWPKSRPYLTRYLLTTAGLWMVLATTANAQDATTVEDVAEAEAAPDEGEIVVTGYRRSIEESLTQKRDANAFVDVITAEDIGKFPDKNVADALQRVPGVVITRDEDRRAMGSPVAG